MRLRLFFSGKTSVLVISLLLVYVISHIRVKIYFKKTNMWKRK